MKTIVTFLSLIISFAGRTQAHLSTTEAEIMRLHPENVFKSGYADNGKKYITTDFTYGTFVYYFNKTTKLTDYCIQIPFNSTAINAQAEIYNKKYTITSPRSWTAYLDDGGIMKIRLEYKPDYKVSIFTYESAED